MKYSTYFRTIMAFTFLFLVVACGGGGGGDSINSGSGTGNSVVSSVSTGEIEGFGSIIVNGIEFETQGAEVEIENEGLSVCSPSTSDDCGLRIGMMVSLENAFDDNGVPRTVTKVKYEDNLEGPISTVVETTPGLVKSLTVMGQTVIVQNGVTRFDNNDAGFDEFGDIGPGNLNNMVEVSGHTDFDGSIRATFIERKALTPIAGDVFEVKGQVSNFNPSFKTFDINGLTIGFAGVVPRDGTLNNGSVVEVKGNALVGNTLQATDIELKISGLGFDDVTKARVEGYVANLNAAAQTFEVNGQRVDYSGAVFIGGTEAELGEGVKVEAEGPVSAMVLQAIKVVYKDSVKFEANVLNVNAAAGTLTLEGLAGITVQSDSLTFLDGFSGLGDLAVGDNLKIRGRRVAPTSLTVIASEIELIDTTPDDRTIIQGTVDGFAAFSSVEIIGVTVDTTTIQNDEFKDDDTIIGENAFYGRIANGDLVKARLDLNSGNWDQIEFED